MRRDETMSLGSAVCNGRIVHPPDDGRMDIEWWLTVEKRSGLHWGKSVTVPLYPLHVLIHYLDTYFQQRTVYISIEAKLQLLWMLEIFMCRGGGFIYSLL